VCGSDKLSLVVAVTLTKTDAKGTDHKQKIVTDIREAIEK